MAYALVTVRHITDSSSTLYTMTTDAAGYFNWLPGFLPGANPHYEIACSGCGHGWVVPNPPGYGTIGDFTCAACRDSAFLQLEYVPVGFPGNPADTNDGNANAPGVQNYGAVAYPFCISSTEVMQSDYAIFLNDVDPGGSNPFSIYNPAMDDPHPIYGTSGIVFTQGAGSGSHYSVRSGFGSRPLVSVSFLSAMRFVNWLHNGDRDSTISPPANRMQTGAYNLNVANPGLAPRETGAKFWIPNMDEWYKAAFYDPNRNSSSSYYSPAHGPGPYWLFPMRADALQFVNPPVTLDRANTKLPSTTFVRSYATAPSFFGTYDQGGNAYEWIESLPTRSVRGGGFVDNAYAYVDTEITSGGFVEGSYGPADLDFFIGFRVAKPCPPVNAPACINPPPNMVLWLPFDEAAGPTARNSIGGNNGTHVNGPIVVAGKVANALSFDGVNDYVEVPDYPAINFGTGDFSLDAWITRETNDTPVRVITDKRSSAGPTGYHMYASFGKLQFQLGDSSATNYDSGVVIPNDGAWHHVAVTVHRNDVLGGRFYIDGAPAGVPFNTALHNGSVSNSGPFRVGTRSFAVNGMWLGKIDEVEVFSRALKDYEIAALYNAGSGGKCKVSCLLPAHTTFPPLATSVNVTAQICNDSTVTQTYGYAFQGVAPVNGTLPGPTAFTPATGVVTLPPGECAAIPVTIGRPAEGGLGLGYLGIVSDYEFIVTDANNTVQYTRCRGRLHLEHSLIPNGFPGSLTGLTCTSCPGTTTGGTLTNTGTGSSTVNYEFLVVRDDGSPDANAVRLNGLPPGVPIQGTLTLGSGQSANVSFDVAFSVSDPLHTYNVLMQATPAAGGPMQPFATIPLRNAILPSIALQSVVSRKTHGAAGNFDILLPLTGGPGIECRRGSPTGAHTLIFTFDNQISAGSAGVTAGTGSVSGTPTFTGNQMTVNLTGVTDVQRITVTLSGVTDVAGQVLGDTSVTMGVLLGDANGSGVVNSTDIVQVTSQSGLTASPSNFRKDVNATGVINSTDIVLTKSRSGSTLPP